MSGPEIKAEALDSLFRSDSPPAPVQPSDPAASSSRTPRASRPGSPRMNGKTHNDAGAVKDEKGDDPFAFLKQDGNEGEGSSSRDDSRAGSPSSSSRPLTAPGSTSRRTGGGGGRKKASATPPPPPKLIDDLPQARDAAHETFETLDRCVYETKRLGLSREQDEMMVCDCTWDRDDPDADPCGPHSDCINRAIFIECLADECRAGKHCRNQRFSRRQFANVEIVQTEMKGFGLRAGSDMPAGTLIYEYIGEVVVEKTFRKRMQQYADEGIKHFYFMMLQKEEYIDATKKGGIGRFANHSCNPNSEVQKWVVGRRLRMGIFTKRDVVKGEEITFNYNVDRYGHDPQVCYCGEPNCVGFIGGKTQTDVGGMNDLFLDALGIHDEVNALEMKGNKKKKGRKLDEDYNPVLRPMVDEEVQKVSIAIRQSMENPKMMSKLLDRIQMTEEMSIHRQLMRMHGFSLMSMILVDMADDRDVVVKALQSMERWKTQIRNKIEDSKVEEPVKSLAKSEDAEISALAKRLLDYWSTLELSYRIPRVSKIASLDAEDDAQTTTIAESVERPPLRRPGAMSNDQLFHFEVAPVRARPFIPAFARARPPPPAPVTPVRNTNSNAFDRAKLDAVIAEAQRSAAAAQAAAAAAALQPVLSATQSPAHSAAAESSRSGSHFDEDAERRKRMKKSHAGSAQDDERRREKELKVAVGEVVVNAMKKYKPQMEHETFKRYAKECTELLVAKEKKNHPAGLPRHPTLDESKKAKMKGFTKEFTHKALDRLKARGKLKKVGHPPGQAAANGGATGGGAGSSSSRSSGPSSGSRSSQQLNGHEAANGGDDSSMRSPSSTATGTVLATPLVSDSWTPLSARGSASFDGDKADSAADIVSEMFRDDDDDDDSVRMDLDTPAPFAANGHMVGSSPGIVGMASSPVSASTLSAPAPPPFKVVTDSWAPKQPRAMALAAAAAAAKTDGHGVVGGANGHWLGDERTPQTPFSSSETSPPYGSS